jgi:hypothetical protein
MLRLDIARPPLACRLFRLPTRPACLDSWEEAIERKMPEVIGPLPDPILCRLY